MSSLLKDIYKRFLNGLAIGYTPKDFLNLAIARLSRKTPLKTSKTKQLIKLKNLRTIVISLSFRKDRRFKIKKILASVGIKFSFFDAIHGKSLTINNLPNHWFSNNSLKYLSSGSIGCILSHIGVWRQLLSSEEDAYMIFEDDIEITSFDKMSQYFLEVPKDYDLVFLGSGNTKNYHIKKFISKHVFVPLILRNGAYGYVISKKGAKKILRQIFPVKITYGGIDTLMGKMILKEEIKAFHIYPSQCLHDDSMESNIINPSKAQKKIHHSE